jgi:hypothetical protein
MQTRDANEAPAYPHKVGYIKPREWRILGQEQTLVPRFWLLVHDLILERSQGVGRLGCYHNYRGGF